MFKTRGTDKTFIYMQMGLWGLIFCMYVVNTLEQGEPLAEGFNAAAHSVVTYAFLVYFNALWLIPRLYRRKKYIFYAGSAILVIGTVAFIRVKTQTWIWADFIIRKPVTLTFKNYTYTVITNSMFFIFGIAYRFTLDFFALRQQQQELLKKHAEAQLSLLKAQVQPHFLFNTLNNIYFVAQRESPITAEMLEKLSAIMRYFLEQGSHDRIPLSAELDFIKNYISLEEMRIRYPLKVNISIKGDCEQVCIAPMLLIPIVENVFKHGIDRLKRDNYIDISVDIGGSLIFTVNNSKHENDEREPNGTGTGLKNLTERLSILYKDDFIFENHSENGSYRCVLNIPYVKN